MALAQTQYGSFYYYAPDAIGQRIASGAFWDEHFKPYMDALGDGVLVDIGSNIGFFTIYCAKRGGWIWSFEASPEVFDLLKRNVEMNEVEINVRCENVPLYNEATTLILNPEWKDYKSQPDGKVDYEYSPNSGGMSLVPGSEGPYVLKSRTLDSYDLFKCNLIKIDTQGSDLKVLQGSVETIRKHRPIVCFEIEPFSESYYDQFVQFFSKLNYSVTRLASGVYNLDCVGVPNG